MNDAEKVAFAEKWYRLGVCPGCGQDLAAVAGVADGHDARDGSPFYGGGGNANHACHWSPDQLAALVHIGSGVVSVG